MDGDRTTGYRYSTTVCSGLSLAVSQFGKVSCCVFAGPASVCGCAPAIPLASRAHQFLTGCGPAREGDYKRNNLDGLDYVQGVPVQETMFRGVACVVEEHE